MHYWVQETIDTLIPLSNIENSSTMKSYMRDQFEFYGIQSIPRRTAMKKLFTRDKLPPIEELSIIIYELWTLPEREFQMVAVDLLITLKKQLPTSMLVDLEYLITTKSWWDTVDLLATHIAGSLFVRYPIESTQYIERWQYSDNIWLRSLSLLSFNSKTC
jgi:3-methyladenine DNA glycosylase AlkD